MWILYSIIAAAFWGLDYALTERVLEKIRFPTLLTIELFFGFIVMLGITLVSKTYKTDFERSVNCPGVVVQDNNTATELKLYIGISQDHIDRQINASANISSIDVVSGAPFALRWEVPSDVTDCSTSITRISGHDNKIDDWKNDWNQNFISGRVSNLSTTGIAGKYKFTMSGCSVSSEPAPLGSISRILNVKTSSEVEF